MRSLFGRHLEYGSSDRLFFREGTIFVVWMWAVKDGVWIEFVRVRFFFFLLLQFWKDDDTIESAMSHIHG